MNALLNTNGLCSVAVARITLVRLLNGTFSALVCGVVAAAIIIDSRTDKLNSLFIQSNSGRRCTIWKYNKNIIKS